MKCELCEGTGIDVNATGKHVVVAPCGACNGTGKKLPPEDEIPTLSPITTRALPLNPEAWLP